MDTRRRKTSAVAAAARAESAATMAESFAAAAAAAMADSPPESEAEEEMMGRVLVTTHEEDDAPIETYCLGGSDSVASPISRDEFDALPLQRKWIAWYSAPPPPAPAAPGSRSGGRRPPKASAPPPDPIHSLPIDTVGRMREYVRILSGLPLESTAMFFLEGVRPEWEDPANAAGGRWMFSVIPGNSTDVDQLWEDIAYSLMGETFCYSQKITGIIVGFRRAYTRISVWVSDREDAESVMGIGKFIRGMGLCSSIEIEFQDHGAAFGNYRHILKK